ncbi:hypothetical protein Pint_20767 [Pistacia integerrima]|uniref:Uncharacterized protein n=1 Tax=Pistacia integerrima TaxID=434235 RepID=A0ACC0XF29_9ROSI|nr:hypothetical protein Pint_20767 [Pistacia integerrima]
MDHICSIIHRLKPTLMMVANQVVYAAVTVLYKLAADDGMSEEQTKTKCDDILSSFSSFLIWIGEAGQLIDNCWEGKGVGNINRWGDAPYFLQGS